MKFLSPGGTDFFNRISDYGTPKIVVDLLSYIGRKTIVLWATGNFLPYLHSRDRREMKKADIAKEKIDMLQMRPELNAALEGAAGAAFLAMSYRGYLVGDLLR